jgi:hypothetical protein
LALPDAPAPAGSGGGETGPPRHVEHRGCGLSRAWRRFRQHGAREENGGDLWRAAARAAGEIKRAHEAP